MEAIDNIHSPSDSQTTVSLEQASNELRSVQKVVLQEESSLPIATPVSDQPAAPGTPEPVAYVGAVAKSPLKQTAQLMQQAAPILSALNVPVLPQTTPGEICQNTIKLNLDQPVDSLPVGARLFMGNLATERTSPMEVASMFVKYGNILEVSLKGSYGFVQFDNPTSCLMAIQCENKRTVCDLKIGSAQVI